MKKILVIGFLSLLAACSKTSSSSSGLITMKTSSGASFSSNNISRTLTTESGKFFFNGTPFDNYSPRYFFSGNFDVHNSLILQIPLPNSTSTKTVTSSNSSTEVTINDKDYYGLKLSVTFTSNVYPGRVAGNYTIYDGPSSTVVLCSGTFDYTAK